jgi:uncharacterized protein YutE (UPF0331/DUF86 family)
MSPLEQEIIRRKLALIAGNLKALEPIASMSEEEYSGDFYKRKAGERILQEVIESAIDINTHVIVEKGAMVPESYFESFIRLGEMQVIPADLAVSLAPSAGLRNRLVHEYDLIEDSLVLKSMKTALVLYTRYVKEVHERLGDVYHQM